MKASPRIAVLICWGMCFIGSAQQQPWHDPNELSSNLDFVAFAKKCQEDSAWFEAYTFIEIRGAIKHVVAAKDETSGTTFFHRNGDMRWVVSADRLEANLSVSLVEGYNGGSESMVWRDQLHCLGGYGLWRKHFDLLRFVGGDKGWELIGVQGEKPTDRDKDESISHPRNGVFYVLEEVMEQSPYTDSRFSWRELDAKTRMWSVRGMVDPRLGSLNGGLGMGDHWVLRNHAGELIVMELDSMRAHVLPNMAQELNSFLGWNPVPGRMTFIHADSAWHIYRGERRTFLLPDLERGDQMEFDILDLSQPLDDEKKIAQPSTDATSVDGVFSRRGTWLPWGLVALLSVAVLWLKAKGPTLPRRSSESALLESESRISPITEKMMEHAGKHLETEELDELLGIAHLSSPETLRSQRARTINRVNTEYRVLHGTDLIVRRQSQEDRRHSVYVIHTLG